MPLSGPFPRQAALAAGLVSRVLVGPASPQVPQVSATPGSQRANTATPGTRPTDNATVKSAI